MGTGLGIAQEYINKSVGPDTVVTPPSIESSLVVHKVSGLAPTLATPELDFF
jgi:hypothetical protein